MQWVLFALLTIALYGIHDMLLKYLSGTQAVLASLIINLSAAVGMAVLYLFSRLSGRQTPAGLTPMNGLWLALAGLCLGLATVTFMKAFSRGAFSVVLPFVYVGIILLSVLAGVLLFREKVSYLQLLGIALSCIGLVLMVRK